MATELNPVLSPAGLTLDPPAEASIRVVLADEHTLMRRSLRRLLDGEAGVEVVAEAGDLPTVVRHVTGHLPRVLVIDLSMSNGSSIEAVGRLRTEVPGTEIVVLSMEESQAFARGAREAGAIGFVLKQAADAELAEAVRRAARGLQFLSPRLAARLASRRRASAEDGLSGRETEVLKLIALGHTTAEIAGRLHLSPRTVESHRARIRSALGLATRAELVGHALRRGLLQA